MFLIIKKFLKIQMTQRIKDKIQVKSSMVQEGVASFIKKTYDLLEDKSHPDIVSWSDCGNFLVIKNIQEFSQKVLPVYFKHSNMNSFIRQLNMYNFHKKRTMTTDHVYFHELFKQGKIDLLRHIKRKLSDSPSNPNGLESLQAFSATTAELSQENLMLKKLNHKAFSRINALEYKINELLHENEFLVRKISAKQRNEETLESTFSDYFQPSQIFNGRAKPIQVAYHNSIPHQMPLVKDGNYSQAYNYSSPYLQNPHGMIPMNQIPTPDTALPSDSLSNVDSFLNLEANEIETSDFSAMNGPQSQSLFDSSDSPMESQSINEDYTILGKRKLNDEDFFPSIDFSMKHAGPSKLLCYSAEEVEDQQFSFPHFEYPLFLDTQEGRC
jgi:heat shock transcription factor 1